MKEYVIDEEFSHSRVDRFCKKVLQDVPGSAIQKMIRVGKIKLNGKKTKPDVRLTEGDTVTFYTDIVQKTPLNIDHNLKIIYEDDLILAVSKPAGLLSHPDGKKAISLSEKIEVYLGSGSQKETIFIPGIVTRLDYNTSGIVIAAKTPKAAREINELSRLKRIEKKYLALVAGVFEKKHRFVNSFIKDKNENKVILNDARMERGEMESIFYPVKQGRDCSLICAEIVSGKSHQIRAQLALRNSPILGDLKYGSSVSKKISSEYGLKRQFLHCCYVKIPHLSGDILISCDLEDDLKEVLNYIGINFNFEEFVRDFI